MTQQIGEKIEKVRLLRRLWHVVERCKPFVAVMFSHEGLGSRDGRTLIWGKLRRVMISFVPPLARYLQKHYKLKGGCSNCGTSCRLLFQCPHWDTETRLCSVYEDRPSVCRLFPITPADIRDRDIVSKKVPCGFTFAEKKRPATSPAKSPTSSSLLAAASPVKSYRTDDAKSHPERY